jgi:pyrimidine-nucleoside phosphorylase
MNPVDLIAKKRAGEVLSETEIQWWIAAYTSGEVPDYQMAAMAMAICFQGLNRQETTLWTAAMRDSGEPISFGDRPGFRIDKHSTGGVGDKISIPLAPIIAALGLQVPMISGRGLGLTGGTLDKLESIPGYRTDLDLQTFRSTVTTIGCSIIGQTGQLAPADRMLYALRDVTATVSSIPLIVSSILSKKLSEGLDALVLDVKFGSGAFMSSFEQAEELARALVDVSRANGVACSALLTDMNQPIGRCVGNALEIVESIEVLRGQGPADTWELTERLAVRMLRIAGEANHDDEAKEAVQAVVQSGRAMARFAAMISAQGGDARIVENTELLPQAPKVEAISAGIAGQLTAVDARAVARAGHCVGVGRERADQAIDFAVGIEWLVEPGEQLDKDSIIARLHWRERGRDQAVAHLRSALCFDGDIRPRTGRVRAEVS